MSRDAAPPSPSWRATGGVCGRRAAPAAIAPRSTRARCRPGFRPWRRTPCGCAAAGHGGGGGVGAEPVRRSPLPPNPQRVGDLYAHGHYLGGLCTRCRPVRGVDFTLAEIEAQLGEPDPLVRDAARRLACPHCGAPILTSVGSISAGNTNARRA